MFIEHGTLGMLDHEIHQGWEVQVQQSLERKDIQLFGAEQIAVTELMQVIDVFLLLVRLRHLALQRACGQ